MITKKIKRLAVIFATAAALCLAYIGHTSAQPQTDPIAKQISVLSYEDLQRLVPDYMEARKPADWRAVDEVVVAGVPYTLLFLNSSGSDLTWAEMKSYLPAIIQDKPKTTPTDDQVIEYVHQLAVKGANNYTVEAMKAFEANKKKYMDMYPDEPEEQVARYINEPYHSNDNWNISKDAQRAHNEYLAIMMVHDALVLRKELQAKLNNTVLPAPGVPNKGP